VQVTWLEDGLQRQRSACSLMTVISTRKHTWTLNKPALGARWCFAWMGGRAAGYGEAATDCVSRVGLRVCCARCNGVGPGVGVVSVSRDGGSRLLLPFLGLQGRLRWSDELPSRRRSGVVGGRKSAPRSEGETPEAPQKPFGERTIRPRGDWFASEITCPGIAGPTRTRCGDTHAQEQEGTGTSLISFTTTPSPSLIHQRDTSSAVLKTSSRHAGRD
jgi:hypothetical protein